ncbi:MAG: MotA/TolQ/ExbB proton channel family protein [Chthoniobacteraceae bacterium]
MKRSLSFAFSLLLTPAALMAQGDSAAKVASAVSTKGSDVTVWNLFQSGGFTMLPLAFMSILAVMLVFAFWITLRRGSVVSNQFMNTAEVLIKKGDYAGLLAIANRHGEAVARIVRRTLDFASKNPQAPFEVVRDIAQTEGAAHAASLQNRITYLADIAVLSPMVGLLGTVFGIIRSFGVMASASASEASRPVLLARGVSEALVATGTGLVIGILSMAFYALFRNKVQNLLSELERATAHLLGLMSVLFVPAPAAAAPEPAPRRTEEPPADPKPRRATEPGRRPSVTVEDEF